MLYKTYDILKSKKFGILLGFSITALMMFGSLTMNFAPERYAGLHGEDINFFFEHVSLINGWFYLMFVGLVFYAINAFLCTIDSVLVRLRAGVKNITLYGGSVVHLAFLVTLLTHLVGGLYATQLRPITITEKPAVHDGVELSVMGIETTTYPNGMPKEVRATIKVRTEGEEFERVLGYNHPVLLDYGAKEFLLGQYSSTPRGVVLKVDGKPLALKLREEFAIGRRRAVVAGVFMPPRVETPVAAVIINPGEANAQQNYVRQGSEREQTINNIDISLEDVDVSYRVQVNLKENPSVPLALVVTALFGVGVVMVIFRLVQKLVHKY